MTTYEEARPAVADPLVHGVPAFVCPDCRAALVSGADSLCCRACGRGYPLRQDFPVFAEGEEFYEEYADEHIPYVQEPAPWKAALLRVLPYHSWREWRFFHTHLRQGDTVIDLGCGRGKEWFTVAGRTVVGVDPCRTALADCARGYDAVAQADMTRLPFDDATFDCAVTSHVFGHIPAELKDMALAEIARVLKPGGRSVNIIETDSEHAFARYAKQDAELYQVNFIETDGHIGLELPSEVLARFRRHGFDIAEARKMESGRIWPRYYEKYLSKGYPERDPHVRRRIERWQRIQRRPVLLAATEVAMGFYHHAIEPRTTPLDYAMFLGVCAVKGA